MPYNNMDSRKFRQWNHLTAAAVFLVSAFTYLSTIEPTASFWDCGEFIASSYKLEVGHPPGNPVFQIIARVFSMFGGPAHAAMMVNCMSALCSALTIFFLYLTIVFFAKRLIVPKKGSDENGEGYSLGESIAIFGSGAVGALAYCFSDTFWFSAVEGEVYAMSSLFTALVVWAMTKWYEAEDRRYANRWIVLIAFLFGLSIGPELAGIADHSVHVLLQDQGRRAFHLLGMREDSRALGGHDRFHVLHHDPLAPEDRRVFRPVLCQHDRPALQHRSGILCAGSHRPLLLGAFQDFGEREGVLEHRVTVYYHHPDRVLDIQCCHHPLLRENSYQ